MHDLLVARVERRGTRERLCRTVRLLPRYAFGSTRATVGTPVGLRFDMHASRFLIEAQPRGQPFSPRGRARGSADEGGPLAPWLWPPHPGLPAAPSPARGEGAAQAASESLQTKRAHAALGSQEAAHAPAS